MILQKYTNVHWLKYILTSTWSLYVNWASMPLEISAHKQYWFHSPYSTVWPSLFLKTDTGIDNEDI